MSAKMGLFETELDPIMLRTIEEIKRQNETSFDDYAKEQSRPTDIQSFYAGKSIFMTGATGFMGKCLVEKLLRDCPELEKLYLLVRPRKDMSIREKLKKYFANVIFDRLRKINPNFEDKVIPVKGDLQEEKLGISPEDRQLLIDNTDIIVHNGATVKFQETVRVALRINVLGTRDLLELAVACKHAKVFAYVSTAYSHCYMKDIEEEFYEPPIDLQKVNDIVAADDMSEEAFKTLLGKWPNIYTFTKAIAEDLVRQYSEKVNFTCCVYRPSIVQVAYKEPLIGWIGNRNGPASGFVGWALGVIHIAYGGEDRFDMIPVDYSINALIAAIQYVARQGNEVRSKVYNFGSSTTNPITPRRYCELASEMASTVGSEQTVWHTSTMFTSNIWIFYILHFFLHFIPAVFGDVALLVMNKKPRALNLFMTATKNLHWLMYFLNFGWRIKATEMRKVFDNISEADRKLFYFNIWDMNWKDYCSRSMCGHRIFIMKEPLDNVEKARRHFALMRTIHYAFLTVFYLFVVYCAMKLFSIIN